VLGFQRIWESERTWVLFNHGRTAQTQRISGLPAGARLRVLHSTPAPAAGLPGAADGQGGLTLTLPPLSVMVLTWADASHLDDAPPQALTVSAGPAQDC
jgi:hypothetical protein